VNWKIRIWAIFVGVGIALISLNSYLETARSAAFESPEGFINFVEMVSLSSFGILSGLIICATALFGWRALK
jgi:hypothetical protein